MDSFRFKPRWLSVQAWVVWSGCLGAGQLGHPYPREHAALTNLGMATGPTALKLIEEDGSSKVENQLQPGHVDALKEQLQ